MPHPLSGTAAEYVWAIPLLPLAGFVINGALAVAGARLGPDDPSDAPEREAGHGAGHGVEHPPANVEGAIHAGPGDSDAPAASRHPFAGAVSVVGPLVVVLAFLLACAIFAPMVALHPEAPFVQTYFPWMHVGDLRISAAFQLDQLSMTMILVITGVGALIHLYSVGYMGDDPGYARYFAYLNLFVFFMLVLVLGASYPVMFVGWEGVGLCSYLLIGFWYADRANADAGKKAFIVNRIGDFGFLIAMFMLFANLGTLDYTGVFSAAPTTLAAGGAVVTTICLFLFLGCVGKSAQIPLYVWLPDAMAGPTPVSALIHAATMVTAGVYLVARSSVLFALAPQASLTVCVVGAVTALFAATIALTQWDIKKVLAYSTISQLGYMFMAVGAGAYVAGIFHLVTHAFFKALLFLGAGSVIYALHAAYHETHSHEDAQDMRNMGGLRSRLPITWALMWVATLANAGVPLFAGFFSKDEVLGTVFERARGSSLSDARWLGLPGGVVLYTVYGIGLVAALLTAIYMTRLMLYTFHGPNRTGETERHLLHEAPIVMTAVLAVLGVLSAFGGFLNVPTFFPIAPTEQFAHWLGPVTDAAALRFTHGIAFEPDPSTGFTLGVVAAGVAILGILIAVFRFKPDALLPKREAIEAEAVAPEPAIERIVSHNYYVDELYDRAIVGPTLAFARNVLWLGVDGLIDGLVNLSATMSRWAGAAGSALESGQVGTYAWALILGVIAVLGIASVH